MSLVKLRIIIIDDEECIRESLKIHLSDLGHEVVTFDSAMACPAFNNHECENSGACADIVLVDHNMPGMTGLEYLKKMTHHGCRVLPRNRVLMTGDATPALENEIKKIGCDIIQKPLRLSKIEELIDQARIFISTSRKLSQIEQCR